jgi:hypothetical protein
MSIEITPDALALAAYIQTLFVPGRDAQARDVKVWMCSVTTDAFPSRKTLNK